MNTILNPNDPENVSDSDYCFRNIYIMFQVASTMAGLSLEEIEEGMMVRGRQEEKAAEDAGRRRLTTCYLVSVILAILVLVTIIVFLTMMTTNSDMEFI